MTFPGWERTPSANWLRSGRQSHTTAAIFAFLCYIGRCQSPDESFCGRILQSRFQYFNSMTWRQYCDLIPCVLWYTYRIFLCQVLEIPDRSPLKAAFCEDAIFSVSILSSEASSTSYNEWVKVCFKCICCSYSFKFFCFLSISISLLSRD